MNQECGRSDTRYIIGLCSSTGGRGSCRAALVIEGIGSAGVSPSTRQRLTGDCTEELRKVQPKRFELCWPQLGGSIPDR